MNSQGMQLRARLGPLGGGVTTCRTPRKNPTGLPPSFVGLGDVLPQHGRPHRRARLLLREPSVELTFDQVLRTRPFWMTLFPLAGWVENPLPWSTGSPMGRRPVSHGVSPYKGPEKQPASPMPPSHPALLSRPASRYEMSKDSEMVNPAAVIAKCLLRRPMNPAYTLAVDFANLLLP